MERSAAVTPPGTASRPVGCAGEDVADGEGDGRGDGAAEFEGMAGEGDGADSLGGVAVGGAFLGGGVEGAAGVGGRRGCGV